MRGDQRDKRLQSAVAPLLLQYLVPYRRLVVAVIVLQCVGTLVSLYLPAAQAAIIDDGVATGDTSTIVELGTIMLLVTGLQLLFSVAAAHIAARLGMGFACDLRSAMFRQVTHLSGQQVARFGAASLLVRTNTDVQQLQSLVQIGFTLLTTATITGVGGVFMTIRQDPGLSWVLLAAVLALALTIFGIVSHMLPYTRRMQKLLDAVTHVVREQLSGIRVIRALCREEFERDRFATVNHNLASTTLAVGKGQALIQPAATLILDVASVALVWFGGMRVGAGQMQAGSLVACVTYAMLVLSAVLSVALLLSQLSQVFVCAERVVEVLSATTDGAGSPRLSADPRPIHGEIRFDNVCFSYPGADRPVLQDVSFTATPGSTTVIVGSTGSGKSTLLSLICRLADATGGAVMVDGLDVGDHDRDRLRSAIGLVPQRAHLFSGSVADNLRFGKTDASDTEIWAALRIAAADGFVRAHPDGLQMPVRQGGVNFSGGQRQRIAIARAVIRRPAIHLLDDAFSALDVHTQARVWSALCDVSREATTIVVSQRVSLAAQADQVIVMDAGIVVGAGKHDVLLDTCPAYAELADSQSVKAPR